MRIFKFVANNDYPISLEAIEAKLSEAMKLHNADGIKGMVKMAKEYSPSESKLNLNFALLSSTAVFSEKGLVVQRFLVSFKYKTLA